MYNRKFDLENETHKLLWDIEIKSNNNQPNNSQQKK